MADAFPVGDLVAANETRGLALPAEAEVKRWLARELHDRVAQLLTTMLVEMEEFKTGQVGRQSVLTEVDSFENSTRAVLSNIRSVLRDLRDEPRKVSGFIETLRSLLEAFEQQATVVSSLRVSNEWPNDLSSTASYNLVRIVEEALTNVRAHSRATRLEIDLSVDLDTALMSITDNGRGILFLANGHQPGMGMIGMKERVAILGGELSISSAAGGGIILSATFPLENLQS